MESADITFRTRKWVRPEDLNANGTLFGGSLLKWIDEEAAIYAILQLGNGRAVTKYISEINFVSSAVQGDLIEMGLTATRFGRTSLTMRAEVRNMITRQSILTIEEIVFVNLSPSGKPEPHGYTEITYDRDRIPTHHLTETLQPGLTTADRLSRRRSPQRSPHVYAPCPECSVAGPDSTAGLFIESIAITARISACPAIGLPDMLRFQSRNES